MPSSESTSEPTTPQKPEPKRRKAVHFPTPTKASVQGTVKYLEAEGIPHSKPKIFEFFGVPRASGYRILKEDSARTRHNNPLYAETRGRKSILSEDEIH